MNDELMKSKVAAIKGFCEMLEKEDDSFLVRVQIQAMFDLVCQVKNLSDKEARKEMLERLKTE